MRRRRLDPSHPTGAPSDRVSAALTTGGVAVAGCLGALVALGPDLRGRLSFTVLQVLLVAGAVALVISSIGRARAGIANGRGAPALGSAVLAVGLLVAVVLPGAQLVTRQRETVLERLGFPINEPVEAVTAAYLLFAVAVLAFVAGERLFDLLHGSTRAPMRRLPSLARTQYFSTYVALLVMGCVAVALQPSGTQQETFAARGGVAGQGPLQLMGYAWPLALAVGIMCRHWGSRWLVALSVGLVGQIAFLSGTRTPLLIGAVALLLRLLTRSASRRQGLKVGLAVVVGAYVGAVLLVGMADWRQKIILGEPTSLAGELGAAAVNPFARLSEGGLDTLDGAILSLRTDREATGATWTDPAKIVSSFVPTQLWPDKPRFLGPIITDYYSSFGGAASETSAGIFLSGPGYGYVVFGGTAQVALLFVALGWFSQRVLSRPAALSVGSVLFIYFLVRFFFGGDAFDAFHVLGLVLVLLFARGLGHLGSVVVPTRGWPASGT